MYLCTHTLSTLKPGLARLSAKQLVWVQELLRIWAVSGKALQQVDPSSLLCPGAVSTAGLPSATETGTYWREASTGKRQRAQTKIQEFPFKY